MANLHPIAVKIKTTNGGRISLASITDLNSLLRLPYYNDIVMLDITGQYQSRLPDPLPEKLQILQCSGNLLKRLPNLPGTLRMLHARDNRLSRLPMIQHLEELDTLDLSHNAIREVIDKEEGLFPKGLKVVQFSNNLIRRFVVSQWPDHLVELDLSENRIDTLDPCFDTLNETCRVDLSHNEFPCEKYNGHTIWLDLRNDGEDETQRKLEMIHRCHRFGVKTRVRTVSVESALPVLFPNIRQPSLQDTLRPVTIEEHMERALQLDRRPVIKSIFNDAHNVHASSIQKSANTGVAWLLTQAHLDDKCIPETMVSTACEALKHAWRPRRFWHLTQWLRTWKADALLDRFLTDSTIHSAHGLTYGELVALIWSAIQTHEHSYAILMVLQQEVIDSTNVCFTGRFTRALNALSGFVKEVSIEISDREQMGNRIVQTLKKVSETHRQGSPEYEEEGRRQLEAILCEFNVPEHERAAWLDSV